MFRIPVKLPIALALLMPCAASAFNPQYYSNESKLSSGRWVKIKVTETGMQQITYDQLREWGFDDPAKVEVYGYGGVVGCEDRMTASLPDDLPRQLSVDAGDRILFYGESNCRLNFSYLNAYTARYITPVFERNCVADAGYYFITDSFSDSQSAPEAPVDIIPYEESDTYRDYHRSIGGHEEEADNPFSRGQLYFGPDFAASRSMSLSFPMPDRYLDSDDGNSVSVFPLLICGNKLGYFDVDINGTASRTAVAFVNDTESYLGFGHTLPQSSSQSNINKFIKKTEVDGADELLNVTITAEADYSYAALDNLTFYYPRKNILRGAQMLITDDMLPAGIIERIFDADERLMVWSVQRAYNVAPFETRYNADDSTLCFSVNANYSASTTNGAGFRAIVFDPEAKEGFHAVEYAGEVANQNLHAVEAPDFVILTTELCRQQAERLAQLHRDYLDHNVLVLDQESIFNEFSSGTPSNMGIRRAVKMFYDRGLDKTGASKMRAFLLFGGGMYDNRALSSTAKAFADMGALTLTYGTKDHAVMAYTTKSYTTDAYYGMVADNSAAFNIRTAQQQVAVGRIPAYNEGDAAAAVDKIEEYLKFPPTFDVNHRALILTDSGDVNSHMVNGEGVAKILSTNSPGITNVKVYDALYQLKGNYCPLATNAFADALKNGVGFVSYSGHGKMDYFSRHHLWDISDVVSTDYAFYPLAILATCHAYDFDLALNDITSEMLFKSKGGMIGVIGHCRTAYQTANQVLNELVAKAYSAADQTTLTGDIYRIARNSMAKSYSMSTQYLDNTLCYNHAGDPALPLYAPDNALTVTAINDVAMQPADDSDAAVAKIVPHVANTVEGFIGKTDDPSQVDETFNGHVQLSLYEAPTKRSIYIHPVTDWELRDTAAVVALDQDILCDAVAPVVDGRFSLKFSAPLPARKGSSNRLTLYAYRNDNSRYVSNFVANAVVDQSAEPDEPTDSEPPVISQMYIDTPQFRSGDVVSNNFTVYAVVEPDESGIRKQTSFINGKTRLALDGTRFLPIHTPNMRNQPDGTTLISYPISLISDGHHEMKLTVLDNVGNSSSQTIEFVVINEPATASLSVGERPARVEATIELDHTFTKQPEGRLVIEDADGNTVRTVDNCSFPYSWDLFDAEGNPVSDGLYSAYAILSSGLHYASTPHTPILVLQK